MAKPWPESAASMAETAAEAGVMIVAGDTKVVEGKGGVFINTAGVGFVPEGVSISASACREGDAVLVSGFLGEHHAAILSSRMGIENEIRSDCAPLNGMVSAMREAGVRVHAMRDVTRGGLATVLSEFARSSGCCVELSQEALPVSAPVKGFCGLLGTGPSVHGNEGKMTAVVDAADAELALSCMKRSRLRRKRGHDREDVPTERTEGDPAYLPGRSAHGAGADRGRASQDLLKGEGLSGEKRHSGKPDLSGGLTGAGCRYCFAGEGAATGYRMISTVNRPSMAL